MKNEAPDRRQSYQQPEPELFPRLGKPGLWKVRYRRYQPDGTYDRPKEIIGNQNEFPTEAAVKKSAKYQGLIERINNVEAAVTFRDLARLWTRDEVSKWVPKNQASTRGYFYYLDNQWGHMRLDEFIQKAYEIKNWLQGDLPLKTNENKQASRQLRKHLRTTIVLMMTYAVERRFILYNPFAGKALSVGKRAGTPPVDRSEFFISPEMFRFLQADLETPGHVKMMQLIAYTTGIRECEFLALNWDVIDFDAPEPMIYIRRSVDGKNFNENAKTETSRTSVPMCDLLGAALLYYREEFPSVNGWLFGSMRTGRPLYGAELQRDYNRPALMRMAAHFKRHLPKGTGFHAYRHAYNALIAKVAGTNNEIKDIQMKLLRHGDPKVNDRYGRLAPTMRERARRVQADVTALAVSGSIN